jgi:hypothetical protein
MPCPGCGKSRAGLGSYPSKVTSFSFSMNSMAGKIHKKKIK